MTVKYDGQNVLASGFIPGISPWYDITHPSYSGGADSTGGVYCTTQFQAAIDTAVAKHGIVYVPAGTYKSGPLNVYGGTQIRGETQHQYTAGFGVDPGGSHINFVPTVANSDLFTFVGTSYAGFRFHTSIEGLYINGDGVNSRRALSLNGVIYGRFANMGIENFEVPIYCSSTINNRFENIYSSGSVAGVQYAGNLETTDVWTQCTFSQCATGVEILGHTIAIRFTDCLWEQCTNYGMDLAMESEGTMVVNGYCEDVPYTANANGCMFRVGYTGAIPTIATTLKVIGGKWVGRNAGFIGNLIDVDHAYHVELVAIEGSQWENIIRTTSNTRAAAIVVHGGGGYSWTGAFCTDVTKVTGIIPSGKNNDAGMVYNGRLGSLALSDNGVTAPPSDTTSNVYAMDTSGGLTAPGVTMGTGSVQTIAGQWSGLLVVNDTGNGYIGLFLCGGGATVLVGGTPSMFSITAGTAGKINVYFFGGLYIVQSELAALTTITTMVLRTRAAA